MARVEAQDAAGRRLTLYWVVGLRLVVLYIALRGSPWRGDVQLHTLMEVLATLLALVVGAMALVRFYSKKNNTFLFIGAGFLGTSFLDGYHSVVTSVFFRPFMPSDLPDLIPWSWIASRQFLSIMVCLSWLAWLRERRLGAAGRISEGTVYLFAGGLTLFCFLFFAFVPLPRAYYPELVFHRPEEFVPALFFLAALIGYLNKGEWRRDAFEHWMVVALIVSFVGQAVFMSFSGQLFDMEFDAAHLLKKVSYVCVLTGLLINMYASFRRAEVGAQNLAEANADLQREIGERSRTEMALREKTSLVELLHRTAANANQALDPESAMRTCLDDMCAYGGWPVGHVYIRADHDARKLTPTDIWRLDGTQRFATLREVTEKTTFEWGVGLPGRVLASGKPAWIMDVTKDPNFVRAKMAGELGVRTGFAMPVLAGREVMAVLEFFSTEVLEPDEAFLDVLVHIGTQLGRVIERKQAERELGESEQRNRAVVDNVIDAIITIDERGVIESFNQSAEKIFGYSAADAIGRNISMLAAEPDRGAHDGYLARYLEKGQAKIIGIGREVRGQRRNGETFPMDLAISELHLNEKRLFVGIVRDITERKRIEGMKNEFISTVSHELRTPLTSIMGSLGLIKGGMGGDLPADASSMIDIAYNNSDRLVRLINDILDMEKIESGKMDFHMEELEVVALVRRAMEENEGYAHKHDVRFVLAPDPPDARLLGDRDRLLQVLANLLSNAAKFSPAGGRIDIAVARQDGFIRLGVTDHGPGIPEAFHDRIFEKFSQSDSSDTRQRGGTGLGLSIVKAIVERHQGSIGFETETGKGTTFLVDLPELLEAHDADAVAEDPAAASRILICEDDPDIVTLLTLILTKGGFEVDAARTAGQAKDLLRRNRYAGMTLNLALPDQNGIDLIRDLRQQPETRDLSIIVLSAEAPEGRQIFNGDAVGIVDWMEKPIDEARLLDKLQGIARRANGMKSRILHVEDDVGIRSIVSALVGDLAEIVPAETLHQGKALLRRERFDLVILDLMLPDGSGYDLLPCLNQPGGRPTPVIVFSAKESPRNTAQAISKVLVKSRTSNEKLLDTIRALIPT